MKIYKNIPIYLLFFFLFGCSPASNIVFPDLDIVYLDRSGHEDVTGFIDSTGTNRTVIAVEDFVSKPFFARDQNVIYGIYWSRGGGGISMGYLAKWQENVPIHLCKQWSGIQEIGGIWTESDQTFALVNDWGQAIMEVDVDRCKKIRSFLEIDSNKEDNWLYGVSLSNDRRYVLYTYVSGYRSMYPSYVIIKMDLADSSTTVMGDGVNPAWSPDNQRISFIRLDGIYTMRADGTEAKKIVTYNAKTRYFEAMEIETLPPYPRWSADGRYLVYHKNTRPNAPQIYKVDIQTGEEELLIDQGVYPYWYTP